MELKKYGSQEGMQALEEAICPETSELARTRPRITEPEDGVPGDMT